MQSPPIRPGLEAFLANPTAVVRGQRLGLVTHAAAVDRELRLTIDRLAAPGAGNWRLARLFGPEHGVRGDVPAGGHVPDAVDSITGLPVSSLYGAQRAPTAEMLTNVDVLVVDLQDVGVRFYTYQSTLAGCLAAAARHDRPVVVLDRPNPIGGVQVEGPLLETGFESFVGRRGQPIRHGLTLGELARLIDAEDGLQLGARLKVVPAAGWRRAQWWGDTGLPWVLPSPNIPTLDTATVYPGTCLFEGTTLSEGRGTTRPFEIVGAPWIEPYRWAGALEERGLPGVRFRPLWFQPVASKHQGARCGGVQLHITDREAFRPVAVAIHLLETARRCWPDQPQWRPPAQAGALPAIDRLYGGAALRERLDAGETAGAIVASWEARPFETARQRALLYQ